MYQLPSGEFAAAVLIGAAAIWFHAWNQFNRPSYQETSLSRILRLLQPSDMRRSSVFLQAYVFYAAILTVIYLLVCLYAYLLSFGLLPEAIQFDLGLGLLGGTGGAETLPTRPQTGASFADALGPLEPVGEAASSGPDASLPLAVALAVVGLAPNVAFLYRFEEWIRAQAHGLSGIPTHLIDSGLKLRSERWSLQREKGLLISADDWELVEGVHAKAAAEQLSERDMLREHALKIVALRNWVLRDGVLRPDADTRHEYQHLEAEVRRQVRDLMANLAAFKNGGPASPPGGTQERKREWENLVTQADEACADICVLVALYSEREAFAAEIKAARARDQGVKRGKKATDPYVAERREATAMLLAALDRVGEECDRESFGTTVFPRLAGSIVLLATLLGLFLGEARVSGFTDKAELALVYAVSSGITYALPLFFALSYQQARLKHDRWANVFGRKKSRAVTQYVILFLVATAIALTGLMANNIILALSDPKVELAKVLENFGAVLQFAVGLETPRALLGGTLAVCVALTIDAWWEMRLPGWRAPMSWLLALLPAALLGGMTWWERARASAAANPEAGQLAAGALLRNALTPALVGLCASIYVMWSLMDEFGDSGRRST